MLQIGALLPGQCKGKSSAVTVTTSALRSASGVGEGSDMIVIPTWFIKAILYQGEHHHERSAGQFAATVMVCLPSLISLSSLLLVWSSSISLAQAKHKPERECQRHAKQACTPD